MIADGLRRAGIPKAGETVLVMGVNGKVGQAATQIATWHGARVIGVVRKAEAYEGHSSSPVAASMTTSYGSLSPPTTFTCATPATARPE